MNSILIFVIFGIFIIPIVSPDPFKPLLHIDRSDSISNMAEVIINKQDIKNEKEKDSLYNTLCSPRNSRPVVIVKTIRDTIFKNQTDIFYSKNLSNYSQDYKITDCIDGDTTFSSTLCNENDSCSDDLLN